MEHKLPHIYLINEDGSEERLNSHKLRFDYQTGARVTVEVSKWDHQELVVRAYHGHHEYERSDMGVTLNLRPGGCNLVRISTELNLIVGEIE